MSQQIRVGFCRKDLTPEGSVALGGFGDAARRMSVGVLDPVYGTCIAITDAEGETVLLYSADLIHATEEMTSKLRESVSKVTGIPQDHIMVSSTHSHSSPAVGNPELESIQWYYNLYVTLMTEAARGALADRAPAEIYVGDAYTEKLNFVRHYRMENGTYGGDNFGRWVSPIVDHASPADNQIQLIKFARETKKNIVVMNWQAHAKSSATASSVFGKAHRNHISADYIGYARKHFEEMTGTEVIFFLGAAGNLNVDTRIPAEMPSIFPDELGKCLADFAVKGMEGMRKVNGGKVTTRQRIVTMPIDHSEDHKVEECKEIWKLWAVDIAECHKVAREHGYNSAFTVRDVIGRSKMGESHSIEIDTVAVGDIAFATAPYEMFCANGMFLKENSPFEKTIVMSCCNGANSYIPSDFAFTHGCYEVDSRQYPRGAAEMVIDNHLEMLKDQKENG